MEIAGLKVFLGDCENRLVLVKIYEAPAEMPDTALIGRLSHYGRVLSFRRGKIARHIENGIRIARMTIHHAIPSYMNIGGEIIKSSIPTNRKLAETVARKTTWPETARQSAASTANALAITPAAAVSQQCALFAWRMITQFPVAPLCCLAQTSTANPDKRRPRKKDEKKRKGRSCQTC